MCVCACACACACVCWRQYVLSSPLRLAAVNEIRVSVTCEEGFDEICSERGGGGGGVIQNEMGGESQERRKCRCVCVCVCVCVHVVGG